MKKARMNISHFRFVLFNLKIFGEIVTTLKKTFSLFNNEVKNCKGRVKSACFGVVNFSRPLNFENE